MSCPNGYICLNKVNSILLPDINYKFNSPSTPEQMYYRYLFEMEYTDKSNIIPYFWMPNWNDSNDPSARTLR